ncbi:hypothetical protein TRVL_10261 [Trypanosoma vivax]|nr:hypothetical protein TRVL_10261 [Trypanosoma vivax]
MKPLLQERSHQGVTPRPRLWAGDGEAAKPRAGVSLASQAAGCFADVAKSCVSDSAGQGQSVVETKALASGGAFTCKRVPVRQLPETEPPPGAAGFFSYSKSITPRGTEAGTLGSRFRSAVTSDPSLSNRARLDANNHIAALRYQRSSSSGVGMSHSNITQYDSWRNRILWLTRMQRGSPRRSSSYSFVRAPSRRVTPEAVAQHFPHSIVNGCEQEDLIRFVDAYNTPSRRQGYEASDPQSVTAGLRQSCEGVYHPLSVTSMPYHNGVPSAAYRLLDPVEKRNNGTLACASLSQLEECQKRLERQRLIINLERKCRSRRHVEK